MSSLDSPGEIALSPYSENAHVLMPHIMTADAREDNLAAHRVVGNAGAAASGLVLWALKLRGGNSRSSAGACEVFILPVVP